MNARAHLERLYNGPAAPVEAPPRQPRTDPGIRPGPEPSTDPGIRPGPDEPGIPDPFRRKFIKPGHEPAPKSRLQRHVHAEAAAFLKANALGEFVR